MGKHIPTRTNPQDGLPGAKQNAQTAATTAEDKEEAARLSRRLDA